MRSRDVLAALAVSCAFTLDGCAPVGDSGDPREDYLAATLARATAARARVLVAPVKLDGRESAIVEFPGGYVAEIHADTAQ